MKKPVLLVILGFPGSGKTYFSENLSKKHKFFHINADMFRHSIFKNPTFSKEEREGVYGLMDILTERLLRMGISVIYDANVNYRDHRKKLSTLAKKANAKHYLIWIQTEVPVAEKRLTKRIQIKSKEKQLIYKPTPIEILHKLKGEMQIPAGKENFIALDGHLPFLKQLEILKKMKII